MKNYLKSLLFAGLVSLGGCADRTEDVEISRGKIGENTEIRLLRNVRGLAVDNYSVEIYDADGNRRAKLQAGLQRDGFIQYDDGRIFEIRDGEYLERKKDEKK